MLRRSLTQFSYLPQTFALVWSASRRWTIAWGILLVIQGVLPASTVYLTRQLVDRLVAAMGAGLSAQSIQTVIVPVALMAGVLLLSEFLQGASEWIRTAQSELVQDRISTLVHSQSIAIDFSCYESSEYNDRLNRARDGASGRSLALLENSGNLLQNSITLLTMAAILIPYGAWLPLVLFASALPAFYIVLHLNKRHHNWWQKTTSTRRRLQYYETLMTASWVAAELRVFDLGSYFRSAYEMLRYRLRDEQLKLARDQSLGRLGAGVVSLAISGVALAWMGRQILLGALTLGDLALFYQAFNRGQTLMRSLLGNLAQIYKNSLFIGNLFEFLHLKPQIVDPVQPLLVPAPLKQGIRFRQITFGYPESDRPILENFNLDLPAGKVVAIVGDNGAGKSTLVKLLCRLYDPQSGSIELDGINLRDFAVADLRQNITVLFQFPIAYYLSALENITLSKLGSIPSTDEIEAAARGAGIHETLERLPQGYNTLLGKWFAGGTELSGGQWQRLALARAFLRRAPVAILDEPTSAMDPWAERDWLDRFRDFSRDRTSLVITHRFTLAMRADIIHVMREGQIVESGTHLELLAQNGFYAQSWKAQMQADTHPVLEIPPISNPVGTSGKFD
ncbi:MAG: ABC transporter ATP-binding protein [Geitlerinemataceae cyanobacterium]